MTDLNAIQDIHALLDGMDLIPSEISRALFELGEVFDRTETAFGTVNLLVKESAQAYGVEAETPFLWPHVRIEMELPGRMAVHVAIQAGNAEAWGSTLAIVRWIKLLLREGSQQQAQTIQLDWGKEIFEQAVVVVDGDSWIMIALNLAGFSAQY